MPNNRYKEGSLLKMFLKPKKYREHKNGIVVALLGVKENSGIVAQGYTY